MREKDQWQKNYSAQQQSPVNPCKDQQTAQQLNDGPPRVVDEPEDKLADATTVFTKDGRNSTRPNLLHTVQRQPDCMFKDSASNMELYVFGDSSRIPAPPDVHYDLQQ